MSRGGGTVSPAQGAYLMAFTAWLRDPTNPVLTSLRLELLADMRRETKRR